MYVGNMFNIHNMLNITNHPKYVLRMSYKRHTAAMINQDVLRTSLERPMDVRDTRTLQGLLWTCIGRPGTSMCCVG